MDVALKESEVIDRRQVDNGVLRFITAGSVDDGKSTLIGRLLYDSKAIFADTLDALARSRHQRTVGDAPDLSLLTDGLEAEREQGITIDVAYRYFATPKRKFIIADTPGHEQYTRNMVTGASTADAAVILIDVSKLDLADDAKLNLLPQTLRHSAIAHLLQIEHLIVAVNKMDLVGYDRAVYDRIVNAYREFLQRSHLEFPNLHAVPMSALAGDNVVSASDNLPWYQGPTLLELLESLPVHDYASQAAFRFPVQLVARHNGHKADNFRGYMGRVEAGCVAAGDQLLVQPGGQIATVARILNFDGPLEFATAGQSITLLINETLDISRGDLLASVDSPATVGNEISADVCWLSEEALDPARKYWLKHNARQVAARVTAIDSVLDIDTLQRQPAANLTLNGIARIRLKAQQPLAFDAYAVSRSTGSFILIDQISHQTVAAGMIRVE